MRKIKRFAALFLCGALTFGALAGCGGTDSGSKDSSSAPAQSQGGEESKDDGSAEDDSGSQADSGDRIKFSMTSYNTIAGKDYKSDAFYDYISEKFNVDIDVMANEPSGAAEKIRIWINGGSLPNAANWEDFNFTEYYTYVDQGLLKPLPDGWETTYPNLAKGVEASGYAEALKVDGKTYGVPHSVYVNFVEMNPPVSHISVTYRKDWAEEVGMSDLGKDYKVSLSEMKEYFQKVKEAGLTSDGAFISSNAGNVTNFFAFATGTELKAFIENEDGFIYAPEANKADWVNMIKTMREWFKEGLIDPDYAVINDIYDARSAMMAGTLAALYDSGDCGNYSSYVTGYQDSFPDQNAYDHVGIAHIVADDGSSYMSETGNYWTVQVFAPETDDATMTRILELMDWICTPEGELATNIGIPEVDWKYAEDGSIEVINAVTGDDYPSMSALLLMGNCSGDEVGYTGVKANVAKEAIERSLAVFDVKTSGNIFKVEKNYTVYSSPTKDNYSVNLTSKISELVANDADIESEWDAFLEENRGMWEPLLNELNEHFGYN